MVRKHKPEDIIGKLRDDLAARSWLTSKRKRMERIWRREGLKVPHKQPKRFRLWLNDGSCIRLRSQYRGMHGPTTSLRGARMMVASYVSCRSSMKPAGSAWLCRLGDNCQHIRSHNGPEFIANAVQEWLAKIRVRTLYITRGTPWENGYCESLNGSMRDERP